jgi:hypothetical protein
VLARRAIAIARDHDATHGVRTVSLQALRHSRGSFACAYHHHARVSGQAW